MKLASADTVRPLPPGARRPRGVYVEPCEVPGKVWVLVFDSNEEEIARTRLALRRLTPRTRAYFDAWLDSEDPGPVRLRLLRSS